MFEIIGLLLFSPFILWQERAQRFNRLSPAEQNLQRASHGAALVALVLLTVFLTSGVGGVADFLTGIFADPAAHVVGLAMLLPLGYGLCRCLVGVRRCWGLRDGLLAVRALVTGALAGGLLWALWWEPVARLFGPDFWLGMLWMFLNAAAVWFIVTGTVRFLLLTLSGGGSAEREVEQHIRRREVVFRGVSQGPWWRFW